MPEHVPGPESPTPVDYPLPKVSPEMAASLLADSQEMGVAAFIEQAEERLKINNPDLYKMMGSIMYGTGIKGDEAILAAFQTMVMTHELLRRQAEAEKLNEMLQPPGETLPE